jgi:hypothetical protein
MKTHDRIQRLGEELPARQGRRGLREAMPPLAAPPRLPVTASNWHLLTRDKEAATAARALTAALKTAEKMFRAEMQNNEPLGQAGKQNIRDDVAWRLRKILQSVFYPVQQQYAELGATSEASREALNLFLSRLMASLGYYPSYQSF